MRDICLFLSLLVVGLPDVVGVKSMEAMRNDVPVHRRSAISQEEEMAGKKRATGEPLGIHGVCSFLLPQ